ncbi:hypothetical protein ACJX0J_013045, partial [Zea mays]
SNTKKGHYLLDGLMYPDKKVHMKKIQDELYDITFIPLAVHEVQLQSFLEGNCINSVLVD